MIGSLKQENNMTLKDKEVIMKVTVKEGIKGFSGKLSFGGTASAGTLAGGAFCTGARCSAE